MRVWTVQTDSVSRCEANGVRPMIQGQAAQAVLGEAADDAQAVGS
jgi:hypothetical protein